MDADRLVRRRGTVQWILASIVIVVIGLGWKCPLLGLTVPAVMLMGIIGGIIRGRYVCGHLCPRGSFFDRMLSLVSPRRDIPPFLRSMPFRWGVVVLLMGFMVYRISLNPGDIMHWGRVFWLMCVITTSIGVVLGLFANQRSWCSFCPIGTMANAFGGGKAQLLINADVCRECRTCEKKCPLRLPIVTYKDSGVMAHRDCLKCPECIAACPRKALSFGPSEDAARTPSEPVLSGRR